MVTINTQAIAGKTGLTYGILAKLRDEKVLNENQNLSACVWSDIVAEVSKENTNNNLYSGGSDFNSNNWAKNFVISAKKTIIEISENCWNTIVDIAKNALEITTETPVSTPDVAADEESREVVVSSTDYKGAYKNETFDENNSEKTVKDYLKDTDYENLSIEDFNKVVAKYEQLKNKGLGENELKERVIYLAKMIQVHNTELEMRDELQTRMRNGNLDLNNTDNIKIEDKEIKESLNKNDAETYYNTWVNNGQGYLDLMDENGDEKVTLKELTNFEIADLGDISDLDLKTLKSAAKKEFDRINKDGNNYIDKNEMAAMLYSRNRITDNDKNGKKTGFDFTFTEYVATSEVLTDAFGDKKDFESLKGVYKELSDNAWKHFKGMNK